MSTDEVLNTYRARLDTLGDDTDHASQLILAAYLAGKLTRAVAVAGIAGRINLANAKATALADYFLAAQITALSGEPTPAVGVVPVDDSKRLTKAVETTLSEPLGTPEQSKPSDDTTEKRLTRLARSEPLTTAQAATTEAMTKQPLIEGWIRELHEGACELCVWWWREGRVWPKSHPLQSHPGCLCSQRIVLRTSIKPVGGRRGRR